MAKANPGRGHVIIYLEDTKERKAYPNTVSINAVGEARAVFGSDNVAVRVSAKKN